MPSLPGPFRCLSASSCRPSVPGWAAMKVAAPLSRSEESPWRFVSMLTWRFRDWMTMINGDSCYSMVCCTIYYVIKWYQWYQLTFSLSFSSSSPSSSSKCTYVTLYLMLVTSFLTMTFVPPQRCRNQASAKPSGSSVVIKPGTVRRGICKNTRSF